MATKFFLLLLVCVVGASELASVPTVELDDSDEAVAAVRSALRECVALFFVSSSPCLVSFKFEEACLLGGVFSTCAGTA